MIKLASYHSGIALDNLSAHSAIDQDLKIAGEDIDELFEALSKEFGVDVSGWPLERFVNLSETNMFTGLYFLWRLVTWPIRARLFDVSSYERLELGHVAKVIEIGHWVEP